jgi:hypothetical protein
LCFCGGKGSCCGTITFQSQQPEVEGQESSNQFDLGDIQKKSIG